MYSPLNKLFRPFDQCDQTSTTLTQSPAALKTSDSQAGLSQPYLSFTHLPRGLVPQLATAYHSSGYCHPSPALAALLAHRNNMLFSYNPCYRIGYPGRFS
jgi:hypothetical protein